MRSSLTFDAVVAGLSIWFIGGSYLDGWAHIHIPDMETFFTPWHAVLYSGYMVTALFLFGTWVRNLRNGHSWMNAIPAGYELSILGAALFVLGGFGDLLWHTLFGIEADLDALLSPTHLFLAVAASLIVTGPLRAAWLRPRREMESSGWRSFLPLVLSLTVFYSILTFFVEYASPFAETMAGINRMPSFSESTYHLQALGIAGFILQASVLMGILLFALRRWKLPFGSLTVVVALNTLAMALMHDGWYATGTPAIIAVGVLAGLSGDLLVWRLRPSSARPGAFRWFGFLMPVCLYSWYYLALFLFGGGVWWTIHMWVGSIFLSGVSGLLLSFSFLPPPLPKD
jgi:hypothetical protein